jgi:ATP-binding cassette, subfamily C (CFTR/MRP), member 1
MGLKIALLLLETQSKAKWMRSEDTNRSPEETSGPFSMSVLFWFNSLMARGVRKFLSLEDLFPLDTSLSAKQLHIKFWKNWKSINSSEGKSRLLRTVWETLKLSILIPILPRLALIGFTFCQPLLINKIIDYLQSPAHEVSRKVGYGLIGATAIAYIGITVSTALYGYQNQRTITKLRACLVSAIYQKTTELKASPNNNNTITLMSSDIERIQRGAVIVHNLWANGIQVGLATYFLQRELGAAVFVSLGTVCICAIVSFFLGKIYGRRQALWMAALEQRVSVITHVISNMKSLKMSGLSTQMSHNIQELREKELQKMSQARVVTTLSTIVGFTPLLITPVLTFAASSKNLDTNRIFTSLSFLFLLANPLTEVFQEIPQVVAAVTCSERIAAYLSLESHEDSRQFKEMNDVSTIELGDDPSRNPEPDISIEHVGILHMQSMRSKAHAPFVQIQNGYFGWESGNDWVLRDINLDFPSSQLTIVIGPIGCGKTTLCKALLGEVPFTQGQVIFRGRLTGIGFCDQIPYLASQSVRDIILGDLDFDPIWYDEVIEATALGADLKVFPKGANTIVGTKGTNLSGGQRQRIAIARALYARPSLVIFDDILSGLDHLTAEHVFQRILCPTGLLRRQMATILLCTHAVQYLQFADHVIQLGADGSVIHVGKFSDHDLSHQYVKSLQSNGVMETQKSTNIDQTHLAVIGKPMEVIEQLDKFRQIGDISIYRYYFSTMGKRALLPFFFLGISFGFTHNFSTIWLKFWSDENTRHAQTKSRYSFYLGIYTMIQLLDLLLLGIYCQQNGSSLALKAGTHLHMKALRTLMNAPMSYFSRTDIGVTTNRFSQDMSIIDSNLAFGLSNTVLTGATVLIQAVVIAIASPYIAIGYPLLLVILYGIQKYYLCTSRQLRFMDLEARSPL